MAPSKLGGAKALPNDNALPENEAKIRGKRLHKLLEHLPAHPKEARLNIAYNLLNSEPISANADDINILAAEAIALLDNPTLSHIFFGRESLAEVGITAYISQLNNNIVGYIDRLVISDTTILAVDFKSNAGVPFSVEQTPIGILAQQAAYFLALEQIYPNHSINIAILWTRTGEIMAIPNNIAINALKSTQELDDSSDHS
jgi:ATP-dependent helicase/nuclease subunit A